MTEGSTVLVNKVRLSVAALILGSGALLSGCGSDDARPTADEVAKALTEGKMLGDSDAAAEVVDCVAKEMVDSDVSDEFLQALVAQDEDFEPSDTDAEAVGTIIGSESPCTISE